MSLHEPPLTTPARSNLGGNEQGAAAALKQLPLPGSDAIEHSGKLIESIKMHIKSANGAIPFSDYMSLALMAPGLGYYSAGSQKFGAAGDFITAPETSVLFAHCIARQCQQVLKMVPSGATSTILEIGAGTGRLAWELLLALQDMDSLPQQYWILEPSADLQQQQRQAISAQVPNLVDRVSWITTLPESVINGVIIGNEVLDVLPVSLFKITQTENDQQTINDDNKANTDIKVMERYVGWDNDRFQWLERAASVELQTAVENLEVDFAEQYQSEVNLSLRAWIAGLAAALKSGLVLLIDYGYPRQEYYHPQRNQGSLLCHYRHRAHADPFVYPGLQDITAHVDFTAVAEAAVDVDLHVAGYNTQGQFLLCCGIDDLAHSLEQGDDAYRMALSQQIKQLTLPSEMGEIFKVIALTRNIDDPLLGFSMFDLRGKL